MPWHQTRRSGEPIGVLAAALLSALATLAGSGISKGAEQPLGSAVPLLSSHRLHHRPSLPLPPTVLGWTRPDTVRLVQPESLFDYMDGGAEVYLSYRFRHLEVCEYSHPTEDPILVEIYLMETSDDAYGLLSLDWSGEKVELPGADGIRALYAGGLLRLWSDDVFVRFMAYRETETSTKALHELAQAIVHGRDRPSPPTMAALFPRSIPPLYKLTAAEPSFFRTQVALNTIFMLGSGDVLDLSPSTAGVIGAFAAGNNSTAPPVYLAILSYDAPESCRRGLNHFRRAYLAQDLGYAASPEEASEDEGGGRGRNEQWAGFVRQGHSLALVLGAPDEARGRDLLKEAKAVLARVK